MAVEAERTPAACALLTYSKCSRTIIPRTVAFCAVFTCRESVRDPEQDGRSRLQSPAPFGTHTSLNSSSLSPWQ